MSRSMVESETVSAFQNTTRRYGGIGFSILLFLLAALAPLYLRNDFLLGVATEAVVMGVWASSLNLMVDLAGLVTLGHAAVLGVAVYTELIFETLFGFTFIESAAIALVATLAVGAVFGALAMRARAIYFIMITLAEGMVAWGLALSWTTVTGGDNGIRGPALPGVFSHKEVYYWLCLAVAVASIGAVVAINRTSFALRVRGCRESASRMTSLGYNVAAYRFWIFVVSSFFAGIAGILYSGYFRFVSQSSVALDQSIEGLVMVLLGGSAFVVGPYIGAIIVVGLRQLVLSYSPHWHLVFGFVLIGVVLFNRRGIVTWAIDRMRLGQRPMAEVQGREGRAPEKA